MANHNSQKSHVSQKKPPCIISIQKTRMFTRMFTGHADYYIIVAKDIGQNQNIDITEHPSIIEIKQHSEGNNFQFHHTTREDLRKILKTLNAKKATGCDQIPAKLLKHASFQIAPVISNIINKALDEGTFPNILKKAEVIPVYKKSDKLNKSNYRPVSILPILAKVFEKVLGHQITPFLNIVFSCHLSAFRQGYGCQDTLLTLIENWPKDLFLVLY